MAIIGIITGTLPQRTTFVGGDNKVIFLLDITRSINPQYSSEVTEFPVEDGLGVTDHIRPKNLRLSIEGFVSEAPLSLSADAKKASEVPQTLGLVTASLAVFGSKVGGKSGSATGAALGAVAGGLGLSYLTKTMDPAKATEDYILGMLAKKQIFTVTTRKRNYPNMVFTSVSFPRDASTGRGLAFSAELQEIRVVEQKLTKLSKLQASVVHSATQKANQGTQSKGFFDKLKEGSILSTITGLGSTR